MRTKITGKEKGYREKKKRNLDKPGRISPEKRKSSQSKKVGKMVK